MVSFPQSLIFDEVDLSDASVAETSTKNINNSFTVREMRGYPPCPSTSAPHGEAPQTPPHRAVGHLTACCWRWHWWQCARVCLGGCSPGDWLAMGWPCKGTQGWWLLQVITPFRKLILCAENRKEMEDWISALKSVQKWEIHEVTWAGGAHLRVSTPQEPGVPLAARQELLPLAQPRREDRSREWGWGDSGGLGGRECQLGVPGD